MIHLLEIKVIHPERQENIVRKWCLLTCTDTNSNKKSKMISENGITVYFFSAVRFWDPLHIVCENLSSPAWTVMQRWQCTRGASKHKKERKTISVWPHMQWSKSEISCDFRNTMCSAEWTKCSWQDEVGSGLTLIYGVMQSILLALREERKRRGSEMFQPSLKHQTQHVEFLSEFHKEDPKS